MRKIRLIPLLIAFTSCALAADSKDLVKAAATKLAAQSNYSWKSTVETPASSGGRMRWGPTEGKTEKDGYTSLTMTRGETTVQAVLKNGKGAIKTDEGWISAAEAVANEDRQNPARFAARQLPTYKIPSVEIVDLAEKTKELKSEGDSLRGDLTEEGAKALMSLGRGGAAGANSPTYSNAKGSVTFWIKDGSLSKYQIKVQGTVSMNGNDREVDRTTTTEIKNVGTTQVEASDEAKKKAS